MSVGADCLLQLTPIIASKPRKQWTNLLESPGLSGQQWCLATLFIDGFKANYDQLSGYQPTDLVGVEIYQRAASAPLQYQSTATGCGVVPQHVGSLSRGKCSVVVLGPTRDAVLRAYGELQSWCRREGR